MLHANTDTSRRGATFLAKNSPMTTRALLVDLVQSNPRASKEDLFDRFRELIEGDEDHRSAIDWYFFVNMLTYAQSQGQRAVTVERRAERQEMVRAATAQVVNQFLSHPMLNGKEMRHCTGLEMAKFGKGYAKIAKRAGAKTVGEVMNESEVRELMAVA
jgi:hypothetical protein